MVSPMKDVQKYEQRPARSAGHGLSVKLTQSTAITRFFKRTLISLLKIFASKLI